MQQKKADNRAVLMLALNVFSINGGIETSNRTILQAFREYSAPGDFSWNALALHDKSDNTHDNHLPFAGNKLKFVKKALSIASNCNIIFLSHLNLLPIGWLLKKRFPKLKLILHLHGIEAWKRVTVTNHCFLSQVDKFVAVSECTKNRFIESNNINAERVAVLNHCIPPNFGLAINENSNLREQFNLSDTDIVLLTITRIRSIDRQKGYLNVIKSLSLLPSHFKYLLCGKIDEAEKLAVEQIVSKYNLGNRVILAGVPEEQEIAGYYSAANIYLMPSIKEGFGISFIEAMSMGLAVIGGGKDGSADALGHGKYGLVVKNPENTQEIAAAVLYVAENFEEFKNKATLGAKQFSFTTFKADFWKLINE